MQDYADMLCRSPKTISNLFSLYRLSSPCLLYTSVDPSAFVLDMGQNLAGFPEITVRGKKGQKITLLVSEFLTDEGACNQVGRPALSRLMTRQKRNARQNTVGLNSTDMLRSNSPEVPVF